MRLVAVVGVRSTAENDFAGTLQLVEGYLGRGERWHIQLESG